MRSVEELEEELYQSEVSSEALADSVAESKVADLTDLVSKTGKMRGHLIGLTPRQYEQVIGRKPRPGLLVKARDATTRKVQWDMVLDMLVSERGYKSDEELRDAIEKAHEDKQELEKAKANQKALRNEIIDKLRAEPEVETITLDDECPQFPESTCLAEVTMVNGMSFRLRRQHSYWRVDAVVRRDYSEKIRTARVVKLKRKLKGKRRPRRSEPIFRSMSRVKVK